MSSNSTTGSPRKARQHRPANKTAADASYNTGTVLRAAGKFVRSSEQIQDNNRGGGSQDILSSSSEQNTEFYYVSHPGNLHATCGEMNSSRNKCRVITLRQGRRHNRSMGKVLPERRPRVSADSVSSVESGQGGFEGSTSMQQQRSCVAGRVGHRRTNSKKYNEEKAYFMPAGNDDACEEEAGLPAAESPIWSACYDGGSETTDYTTSSETSHERSGEAITVADTDARLSSSSSDSSSESNTTSRTSDSTDTLENSPEIVTVKRVSTPDLHYLMSDELNTMAEKEPLNPISEHFPPIGLNCAITKASSLTDVNIRFASFEKAIADTSVEKEEEQQFTVDDLPLPLQAMEELNLDATSAYNSSSCQSYLPNQSIVPDYIKDSKEIHRNMMVSSENQPGNFILGPYEQPQPDPRSFTSYVATSQCYDYNSLHNTQPISNNNLFTSLDESMCGFLSTPFVESATLPRQTSHFHSGAHATRVSDRYLNKLKSYSSECITENYDENRLISVEHHPEVNSRCNSIDKLLSDGVCDGNNIESMKSSTTGVFEGTTENFTDNDISALREWQKVSSQQVAQEVSTAGSVIVGVDNPNFELEFYSGQKLRNISEILDSKISSIANISSSESNDEGTSVKNTQNGTDASYIKDPFNSSEKINFNREVFSKFRFGPPSTFSCTPHVSSLTSTVHVHPSGGINVPTPFSNNFYLSATNLSYSRYESPPHHIQEAAAKQVPDLIAMTELLREISATDDTKQSISYATRQNVDLQSFAMNPKYLPQNAHVPPIPPPHPSLSMTLPESIALPPPPCPVHYKVAKDDVPQSNYGYDSETFSIKYPSHSPASQIYQTPIAASAAIPEFQPGNIYGNSSNTLPSVNISKLIDEVPTVYAKSKVKKSYEGHHDTNLAALLNTMIPKGDVLHPDDVKWLYESSFPRITPEQHGRRSSISASVTPLAEKYNFLTGSNLGLNVSSDIFAPHRAQLPNLSNKNLTPRGDDFSFPVYEARRGTHNKVTSSNSGPPSFALRNPQDNRNIRRVSACSLQCLPTQLTNTMPNSAHLSIVAEHETKRSSSLQNEEASVLRSDRSSVSTSRYQSMRNIPAATALAFGGTEILHTNLPPRISSNSDTIDRTQSANITSSGFSNYSLSQPSAYQIPGMLSRKMSGSKHPNENHNIPQKLRASTASGKAERLVSNRYAVNTKGICMNELGNTDTGGILQQTDIKRSSADNTTRPEKSTIIRESLASSRSSTIVQSITESNVVPSATTPPTISFNKQGLNNKQLTPSMKASFHYLTYPAHGNQKNASITKPTVPVISQSRTLSVTSSQNQFSKSNLQSTTKSSINSQNHQAKRGYETKPKTKNEIIYFQTNQVNKRPQNDSSHYQKTFLPTSRSERLGSEVKSSTKSNKVTWSMETNYDGKVLPVASRTSQSSKC